MEKGLFYGEIRPALEAVIVVSNTWLDFQIPGRKGA